MNTNNSATTLQFIQATNKVLPTVIKLKKITPWIILAIIPHRLVAPMGKRIHM
jgi:hypothetical protein